MPSVSIILIFLDAERFLAEAIASVIAQTFADWELILVDDGSTDSSKAIAQEFAAADPRIRYTAHPDGGNHGRSASRNLGVAQSGARYIAFLDADDVWQPVKLSEQVALLEQMPDVPIVFGALNYWYSWDPAATKSDRVVLCGGLADERLDPPEAMLRLYPLGPGQAGGVDCLVRRDVFEALGGFEEQFHGLYDDQALFTKIFLRHPIYISSRPWLLYRQHPESCCAVAWREKSRYHALRGIFLKWLAQHIRHSGLGGSEVTKRLANARWQLRREIIRRSLRNRARLLLGARR